MGQHITSDNSPGYPLAFFFGGQDKVIAPISDVKRLASKWEDEAGVQVSKKCLPFMDHVTALPQGLIWGWKWMNRRFSEVDGGDSDISAQDDSDLNGGFECLGYGDKHESDEQLVLGSRNEL